MAAILDDIKPYRGGNDALYALRDLDDTDKHRLLIPTITITALTNVNARIGNMTFANCTLQVGEGGVLNLASMPGDVEIQGSGDPAFAVLFDEVEIFKGQLVVPTLRQLSEAVSRAVQAVDSIWISCSRCPRPDR